MTSIPPPSQPAAKTAAANWKRLVAVWVLLALAMTAVALVCGAVAPRNALPAPAARSAPLEGAELEGFLWPRDFPPSRAWRFIIIHHSGTPSGTVESIDQGHRDRGFTGGVGYHFMINNGRSAGTADGQITPTVRWLEQLDGAHTRVVNHAEFNTEGIGICLIGNFDQQPPTPLQMVALERLVQALRTRYDIPLERVLGHGELKNTQCPGKLFPMDDFLMDLRQAYLRTRLMPVRAPADGLD